VAETMARSRVTLFLPSLGGGGAERAMVHLASGLADAECEVAMVVAESGGAYTELVSPKVELIELGVRRTGAALPGLIRHLRQWRPAAILAVLPHANILAVVARALARVDARLLVCEQATVSPLMPYASWKVRLVARGRRHFYARADKVIAVAEGTADDLVEHFGIPRENIEVIFNPMVTTGLTERAAEPVEHPFLVPGSPPVILAVGRLDRQKNFPLLLAAFVEVRRKVPARLLILGEGGERQRLEEQIDALGLGADVDLPGFVDNPYACMARARLFVLSSDWEGLPSVLIEAMAVGCPVVSTDCPSGPREILDGGRLAPLVPPGDAEALARAILETLAAPPDPTRLRQRAEQFSLDRIVPRYKQALGIG